MSISKIKSPIKKRLTILFPLTGKAYLYSENITLKKGTLLFLKIMGTGFLKIIRTKKSMSISVIKIYLLPMKLSAIKIKSLLR